MLNSFLSAFSMFSKIPVKPRTFDDENGSQTLCFLPIVGIVCGVFTFGVYLLLSLFRINSFIKAVMLLISLFIISGFLHLDGYMDTSDAILSARDRSKKVEILKDSVVGAFSVICLFFLLLTDYVSLFTYIERLGDAWLFIVVPFLSRAIASFILFTYKPLSNEGILAYFRTGSNITKTVITAVMALAGIICCFCIGFNIGVAGGIGVIAAVIFAQISQHQFGGINGDVIGFCIVVSEAVIYLMSAILI